MYLEQPPARVEIFDAFHVARRQLDVGWTESGRQLVHVYDVILNGSDLVLELLQHTHTHTQNPLSGHLYHAALFTVVRGQMGHTDRLLVALGSVVSHLHCSNSEKQMHPSCKDTFSACLMLADVWRTLTGLSRINETWLPVIDARWANSSVMHAD